VLALLGWIVWDLLNTYKLKIYAIARPDRSQ
jgi:hypothetical protein